MTRNRKFALRAAAALALCGASALCFAQADGTQIAAPPAAQSQKIVKTRFEVLHMMYQAIQVRSLVDMREIHTFTYAPEIRDQMQKMFDAGGYQYGDKIVVWYQPGANLAVKIKGKASKPK
jgi:hypothetical protein